jgi:hypothetical protein
MNENKEPKPTYRTPSTVSEARPVVDGTRVASDKSTQGSSTKTGATVPTDSDRSRSRSPDGVRKPHGNRHKRYQTNPKSDKKHRKDEREALLVRRNRGYDNENPTTHKDSKTAEHDSPQQISGSSEQTEQQ